MKKIGYFMGLLLSSFVLFAYCRKKFCVSTELATEMASVPLETTGSVPPWLSGTLVRNGPVRVTVDGQTNAHWFDGLAMLHGFHFNDGKVCYSNQFLKTDAYRKVFQKGSLNYVGFATDPCSSVFKKLATRFFPEKCRLPNANINVAKYAGQYVALTEVPLPVVFDKNTLSTLGGFNFQDSLPKTDCWESAHPHHSETRNETINYLIDYGRTSFYTLYRFCDRTCTRDLISKIPVDEPAYMHSFALTQNFIILTEFPLTVKPLDFIIKDRPFIENFTWHPSRGTRFIVVERNTGQVQGCYQTRPFFAFHHANAYEEGEKLHLDIVTYDDPSIICKVARHFEGTCDEASIQTKLERFTLDLCTGEILSDVLFAEPAEYPRINEAFDAIFYRYLYLADARDPLTDSDIRSLYKIDTQTKAVLDWSEEGCYPGEPVFVEAPGASDEDEGVILSVVINERNCSSFLLILNAKTFTEIARAKAPHLIPSGLHGKFFE